MLYHSERPRNDFGWRRKSILKDPIHRTTHLTQGAAQAGSGRERGNSARLVPYSERVDRAVQRIRKNHKLTDPQSKWLDRIAKQLKLETIVNRASLETGQFKADGGFTRLNKVFDGKLENLLTELADEVWKDAG